MIRVTPQPEPRDFNKKVRERGQRFIATNPRPTGKQFKKKAFWKSAANDLRAAYGGICAYTCFYILSSASVDHFLPKSLYPKLAYEWSNFRLSRPQVNQYKADSMEVIDPFVAQTGWFVLDFPSCLVRPSNGLPAVITEQVNKSIQILKINEDDTFVQERCDLMLDFAEGKVTLTFLSKRYPFLATEIVRQGIQTTAITLFKRRSV
ncbi:MAG: hypothetical protein Q7J31_12885 [Syntrophales bacterium]|nr:hypothetical protein [Syntrophales bacterium]